MGVYNDLGLPNFEKSIFFIRRADSQSMAGMDALSESAEMMIKNMSEQNLWKSKAYDFVSGNTGLNETEFVSH